MSEALQSSFWHGPEYEAGYLGVRLLVLGEAAYSRDSGPPSSPRQLVEWHINPDTLSPPRRWLRTYTRFTRIMGAPRPQEAWNRLAFHNYLLTPGGSAPRQSPPADDPVWREAKLTLESVSAALQPQAVIVWGFRLWGRLAEPDCVGIVRGGDGVGVGEIQIARDTFVPAFRLQHPSSCPKVDDWAPRIRKFVEGVRKLLGRVFKLVELAARGGVSGAPCSLQIDC